MIRRLSIDAKAFCDRLRLRARGGRGGRGAVAWDVTNRSRGRKPAGGSGSGPTGTLSRRLSTGSASAPTQVVIVCGVSLVFLFVLSPPGFVVDFE